MAITMIMNRKKTEWIERWKERNKAFTSPTSFQPRLFIIYSLHFNDTMWKNYARMRQTNKTRANKLQHGERNKRNEKKTFRIYFDFDDIIN